MEKLTYAAINNNLDERLMSSSGGIFVLLARYVFSRGGVVYGVSMTPECDGAEFVRVNDLISLPSLLGSKYLQAKLGDTFKRVKNDLEAGLVVLFIGTGCQVNGLKRYLNKSYSNLYAVDVVCHGVPSPKLWRSYVAWIENKYKYKLRSVNFRCKDYGWSNFGLKRGNDGKYIFISRKIDPYMQFFLKNYSLRPSCYNCMAKNRKWLICQLQIFGESKMLYLV